MLTSLDLLVIVFMATSALSLLALCLMFLLRHGIVKKISFYFLTLQGMLLAWMNAMMLPVGYESKIALGWGLGAVSVAALLLEICGKSEKKSMIARILAAVSVIAGVLNTFLF